ncbi:hypothetical protein GCM10028792_27420 [Salinisphaera aquimarina]
MLSRSSSAPEETPFDIRQRRAPPLAERLDDRRGQPAAATIRNASWRTASDMARPIAAASRLAAGNGC